MTMAAKNNEHGTLANMPRKWKIFECALTMGKVWRLVSSLLSISLDHVPIDFFVRPRDARRTKVARYFHIFLRQIRVAAR